MDSEQQTFMMALPTDMRDNFDRLYAPFSEGRNVDKGLETYKALNKFLAQFVSRVRKKENDLRSITNGSIR